MVSWSSHRVIGQVICGTYYTSIDELIDNALGHDSSRYDIEKLYELYKTVKCRYGEQGLCYAVLHHYIDRLSDIIASEFSNMVQLVQYINSIDKNRVCELFIEDIRSRLLLDPKNIFNLIYVGDPRRLLDALYLFYSGKRKRRTRSTWEDIILSNFEKLKKEPYNSMAQELRGVVNSVIAKLKRNFNNIVYLVLTDKEFETTLKRALHAVFMKITSITYRMVWGTYRGSREEIEKIRSKLLRDVEELIKMILQCFQPLTLGPEP